MISLGNHRKPSSVLGATQHNEGKKQETKVELTLLNDVARAAIKILAWGNSNDWAVVILNGKTGW